MHLMRFLGLFAASAFVCFFCLSKTILASDIKESQEKNAFNLTIYADNSINNPKTRQNEKIENKDSYSISEESADIEFKSAYNGVPFESPDTKSEEDNVKFKSLGDTTGSEKLIDESETEESSIASASNFGQKETSATKRKTQKTSPFNFASTLFLKISHIIIFLFFSLIEYLYTLTKAIYFAFTVLGAAAILLIPDFGIKLKYLRQAL